MAVLMPYRGTGGVDDLRDLCMNLPAHLDNQGVRYRLYLVRQMGEMPFNRGALVNAAVRLLTRVNGLPSDGRARALSPSFDYLAVHDIDRFPVRGVAGVHASCANATADYYAFPEPMPRVLHPLSFAGGVLVLTLSQYEAVNGFSNQYWGWGEEDNDLFLRLRWCGWAPQHGRQLEACMEHRDCPLCKRQKQALDQQRLRSHEERVRGQLRRPSQHLRRGYDGLWTVNFTLIKKSRSRCGGVNVNVLYVQLHGSDPGQVIV